MVSCPITNPLVQMAWKNHFSPLYLSHEQESELGTRGLRAEVEDQSCNMGGSSVNRRMTTNSILDLKRPSLPLDRTSSAEVEDFAEKMSSKKDFRGERTSVGSNKGGRGWVADLTKVKLLPSLIVGEDRRSGELVHKVQLLQPTGSYQLREKSPQILSDLSSDKFCFKKFLHVGLNQEKEGFFKKEHYRPGLGTGKKKRMF